MLPQRVRSAELFDSTMQRFATELSFDALKKTQTSDRDRFRPAMIPHHHLVAKRVLDPLLVCLLKLRHFGKAT